MSKVKTIKCFKCKGKGAFSIMTGLFSFQSQKCTVCNGTGRIKKE